MPHDNAPLPTPVTRRRLFQSALSGAAGVAAWYQGWPQLRSAAAQKQAPSGQMTWAIHVTIAPTWLDPAETVHDAVCHP
jgi:hypothetical protein